MMITEFHTLHFTVFLDNFLPVLLMNRSAFCLYFDYNYHIFNLKNVSCLYNVGDHFVVLLVTEGNRMNTDVVFKCRHFGLMLVKLCKINQKTYMLTVV